MLRALGHTVQTDAWAWIAEITGQKLFEPPNVAGWNYAQWLDTARWAGRLTAVNYALGDDVLDPSKDHSYPAHETPTQAVRAALAYWDDPALSPSAQHHLLDLSRRVAHSVHATWEQVPDRVSRQNALRALIPMTPDWQTC
jgi:hypothetical protein